MKPTKDQIMLWLIEADSRLPGPPSTIASLRERLEAARKDAYAAGRKAGMEEAVWICRARITGDHTREDQEAVRCVDAIRAAMEADK